jgi:hypothetical protein
MAARPGIFLQLTDIAMLILLQERLTGSGIWIFCVVVLTPGDLVSVIFEIGRRDAALS